MFVRRSAFAWPGIVLALLFILGCGGNARDPFVGHWTFTSGETTVVPCIDNPTTEHKSIQGYSIEITASPYDQGEVVVQGMVFGGDPMSSEVYPRCDSTDLSWKVLGTSVVGSGSCLFGGIVGSHGADRFTYDGTMLTLGSGNTMTAVVVETGDVGTSSGQRVMCSRKTMGTLRKGT